VNVRLGWLVAGSIVFSGCAGQSVAIKSGYRWQTIQRVALLGFEDAPGYANTGTLATGVFEKWLMQAGYSLVERRDLDRLLAEHKLSRTGVLDPLTARQIGKVLGVDAIVVGQVTAYSPVSKQSVAVPVYEETTTPIYHPVQRTRVVDGKPVMYTEQALDGYETRSNSTVRVDQQYSPAQISISVRMVDVESGEVVWTGSSSDSGMDGQAAADDIARRIVVAVQKAIRQSQEEDVQQLARSPD
jgi:hypothetical protein